jgi:hypothetical protein
MIKSRRMIWAGHGEGMGEKNTCIFLGKSRGNRPLGRQSRRWKNNNLIDLRVTGLEGVDWINLPQDRDQWRALVKMVMNIRFP